MPQPPNEVQAPQPPRPGESVTPQGRGDIIVQPPPPRLGREEIASLRARRSELSDQLSSAASRRNRLADELKEADPAARAGLEQRIAVLDERIVQLESDIAETGRQLTSSEGLIATTAPANAFGLSPGNITAISIVFTIFVLAPLALALARLLWKRATTRPPPPLLRDVDRRFEQLEHAVDSIAIEVERISEGQRFVTKLLTEGNPLEQLKAPRHREPVSISKSDPHEPQSG